MSISVLFCLALSVYSVSAWNFDYWWPWNRPQCVEFYSWEVLGLNYTNIIKDVKRSDVNADGIVTFAEFAPPPPDPPANGTEPNTGPPVGFPRCLFVADQVARNNMDRDTTNYVFDIIDRNGDNVLNAPDNSNPDNFNAADVNSDGKVSVCELVGQYVRTIEKAQRQLDARKEDLRKIRGEERSDDWYSWLTKKFNSWYSDWL